MGGVRGALAYATAAIAVAAPALSEAGDDVVLPSGLTAYLQEMLWDRPGGGLVYRFRFVAPEFVADLQDFDVTRSDLEYLCNVVALPKLPNIGPEPSQIVISLADRESEFGVIDADLGQVFEAYSVQGDTCVWEVF